MHRMMDVSRLSRLGWEVLPLCFQASMGMLQAKEA